MVGSGVVSLKFSFKYANIVFRSEPLTLVNLSRWLSLMVSHRCAVRWPLAPHNSEWHEPQLPTTISRPGPAGNTAAGVNFSVDAADDGFCTGSQRELSDSRQPASNERLSVTTKKSSARSILVPPIC